MASMSEAMDLACWRHDNVLQKGDVIEKAGEREGEG